MNQRYYQLVSGDGDDLRGFRYDDFEDAESAAKQLIEDMDEETIFITEVCTAEIRKYSRTYTVQIEVLE